MRGGLILWSCKELGNALKGSPFDTLNRSCLLEERSDAASYSYDAPGASYSLKWIFHNDLGFKREYSQLEIEAKARAEELKESNSNLVVVKGNRKNQVTWKGDGFEGKRNGTGNGGDGKDIDNWNNGAFDVYKLQKKVRNKGGNGKEIDTDITKVEPKKLENKEKKAKDTILFYRKMEEIYLIAY
ncbi:unnamed protein product [Vicia faba]|uniref:Signal recognition particle receptor alpha subunit N-terminal domain-containing protein n=1 Tax=Vicia faba TaxID=3906 RepID=A0AAV1A9J4_VICFA|nr:unnamed protein product [Vicia faba]